jgi:hypothetical protein
MLLTPLISRFLTQDCHGTKDARQNHECYAVWYWDKRRD